MEVSAWLRYGSLALLVAQDTALVLLLRYSRSRGGPLYASSTAVCAMELLKLAACLVALLLKADGKPKAFARSLRTDVFIPREVLRSASADRSEYEAEDTNGNAGIVCPPGEAGTNRRIVLRLRCAVCVCQARVPPHVFASSRALVTPDGTLPARASVATAGFPPSSIAKDVQRVDMAALPIV